jgi:hypothetical protein
MGEQARTVFTRLFEVRVLHHYWLDEGTTEFGAIPDDDLRMSRLLTYDVRDVVTVEPSGPTSELVGGLRGVIRATALGLVVAVPDDATVPLDSTFELHLRAPAPDYAAYTALTLRPQSIVDVTDPADGAVHRYKANVPVLTNASGARRGSGARRRLFLSTEYGSGAGAGDGVEALVTSGSNVRQLTGDPPDAPLQTLGAKSALPVYVHQGDVPVIVPPTGSTGAPPRGVELTPDIPADVIAIIRLSPRRTGDNTFSFANANGTPRTPTRKFEVHLRNRWTNRRYRDRRDGSVMSTEADPTPLTYFGNAGTKRKPPTVALDVQRDAGTPARITQLISDIYV